MNGEQDAWRSQVAASLRELERSVARLQATLDRILAMVQMMAGRPLQ